MLATEGSLREQRRSELDEELSDACPLPRRGELKAVVLEERGHVFWYVLQVELGSHREAGVTEEEATVGIPVK